MTTHQINRRGLLRGAVLLGSGAAVLGSAGPAFAARTPIYNPFLDYVAGDGWQDHQANGSLGGRDYEMAVGTALPAAGAGIATKIRDNGTGGHTVTIAHPDGWQTQYLHLSEFERAQGAEVGQGDTVGWSGGAAGAPGAGSSTGPHVHWHMIDPDGVRRDPLNQVS
jgi:murein DD-endopeptidase MepM/ murein hydrolase activator NlpD